MRLPDLAVKFQTMIIIQLDSEQLSTLIQSSIRSVLSEQSPETTSKGTEQPLTLPEAATFLSISKQTLYKRTMLKEIPCLKRPGEKRIYFLKEDLIGYLKAGRTKTRFEIEADRYLPNKKGRKNG